MKSVQMPKVSVIVPNFNHEKYLRRRLNGVLNQTFDDYEVIILDDNSYDNSRAIIEEYRSNPKVTKVLFNKENSGNTFSQWNKGIINSSGEYIWIAESDDDCDSEFLGTLIKYIEKSDSVVLAYCQSMVINEEGLLMGSMTDWTNDLSTERWKTDFSVNGISECKNYFVVKDTIPNASAVLFRRNAFLSINSTTSLRLCGDWLIWSRLIKTGDISYCSQHLNYFRRHDLTLRSTVKGRAYLKEFLSVVREILSSLLLNEHEADIISEKFFAYWSRFLSYKRPVIAIRFICVLYRIAPKKAIKLFLHVFFKGWNRRINRRLHVIFNKE